MRIIWWVVGSALVIFFLVLAVMMTPSYTPNGTAGSNDNAITGQEMVPDSTLVNGRYVDYSAGLVGDNSYDLTILFFYAPWCPECRSFDQAINADNIPQNTQILKVDYDTSQDLRQQYGITIQSSFVRVDHSGNKQSLWIGYGKDKSLNSIVENTK